MSVLCFHPNSDQKHRGEQPRLARLQKQRAAVHLRPHIRQLCLYRESTALCGKLRLGGRAGGLLRHQLMRVGLLPHFRPTPEKKEQAGRSSQQHARLKSSGARERAMQSHAADAVDACVCWFTLGRLWPPLQMLVIGPQLGPLHEGPSPQPSVSHVDVNLLRLFSHVKQQPGGKVRYRLFCV